MLLGGLTTSELNDYLKHLRATPFTNRTVVAKDKLHDVISAVREAGFALVDQELEIGLRSIAVPQTPRPTGIRTQATLPWNGPSTRPGPRMK